MRGFLGIAWERAVFVLYVLAFLAGAPAGRSPGAFAVTPALPSPAVCQGQAARAAAARWSADHLGAVVVGTRCAPAERIELAPNGVARVVTRDSEGAATLAPSRENTI